MFDREERHGSNGGLAEARARARAIVRNDQIEILQIDHNTGKNGGSAFVKGSELDVQTSNIIQAT